MPNILGAYDEIAYGQEALALLEMNLGMANTIHREYDPVPKAHGATMSLRRPATFVAQDQPQSVATDAKTETVNITFSFHKGTLLKVTDKELSLSNDRLIDEHIRPQAYAIGKAIDDSLVSLGLRVPYYTQQAAAAFDLDDLSAAREVLVNNNVPLNEDQLYGMINGRMERNILSFMGGKNIAGAKVDEARVKGAVGQLMGINWFVNQNTPSFQTTQVADVTGVAGAALIGATSVGVTGLTASQASGLKQGDTFSIAGHSQRYVLTAAASTDGAGAATLAIEPGLQIATVGSEVLDFHKITGAARGMNLVYNRNAFALVMAPLSDAGARLAGAKMSTVEDPKTQLTLRSRFWYDGKESALYVGLDALWAVQVLDEQLATRFYNY